MPSEKNLEEARNAIFSIPSSFEKANGKVHKVEDQWHYPILTKVGFVPKTKSAIGFVRSYEYEHPSGIVIIYTSGSNRDYWNSSDGSGGLWTKLGEYICSKFGQCD